MMKMLLIIFSVQLCFLLAHSAELAEQPKEVLKKVSNAHQQLFEILQSHVIRPKNSSRNEKVYEVNDVQCSTQISDSEAVRKCSYLYNSASGKSKKKNLTQSQSEQLFDFLVSLPVTQGDSGLAVDFIRCTKVSQKPPHSAYFYCSVALPICGDGIHELIPRPANCKE